LRIPKGIATDMELKAGDAISIKTTEDGIILKKTRKRPEYSLEELLRGARTRTVTLPLIGALPKEGSCRDTGT
jgi:AbrB family looped-hinge helix DNA binding protein